MPHFSKILWITIFSIFAYTTYAQAPIGVHYQSVARDGAGIIVANHSISVKFTIHDGGPAGGVIYRETHNVLTNQFGTFSVVIGGGIIQSGSLGAITWGAGTQYLQVEMDYTGGGTFTDMGAAQLISVPYALYANSSAGDVSSIKFDTTGTLNILNIGGNLMSTIKKTWFTNGNAGINPATDFLGTTDNIDVIFKRGAIEGWRITAGGAWLATGGTGATPAAGAGRRMMWIPAKSAFRAGMVTGTYWDNANIGNNSIALGSDVLASGLGATAIGSNDQTIADMGTAIGTGLIAKSYMSTVVGTYNDTTGSGSSTSDSSGVLFQVGSGSSSTTRSNAITITKAGKVMISNLLINQSLVYADTSFTTLTNFTLYPGNKSFFIINALGLPLVSAMTIASGNEAGQIIVLEVKALTALNGIRLVDNTSLLSLNSTIDMLNNDTMIMMWDGLHWIQMASSANH